jgi:arsenate reductase
LYTFKEKSFIAVWAQTAATHFHVKRCFAIQAAQKLRHYYSLWQQNIGTSRIAVRPFLKVKPCLQYKIWNDAHPIIGFSKTYDDSFNPQSAFAAILTCSQADGPFLLLVLKRIPITFEDPKAFDNTPNKKKKYERSVQIATELFYVFSKIKK